MGRYAHTFPLTLISCQPDAVEIPASELYTRDFVCHFSNLVQQAEDGEYADGAFVPRFRSTRYQLVYYAPDQFDADGRLKPGARGSYKFPKGTNIGFFIISGGLYALDRDGNIGQGAVIDHRRIAFSRPVMNRYIGNTINDDHTHQTTGGNNSVMTNCTGDAKDWTAFVRYRWNGQRLLGVEDYFAENDGDHDGGDHDMNDIIFRVNGEFENKADRSHKATINVDSWAGRGASVTIKVPANFGLTLDDNSSVLPSSEQHMGGFRVMVGKPGEGNSTIITAPHKNNSFEAPQMFLVPSKWFWPVEEQEIDGVYSGFIKWVDSWWTRRDGYAGGRVIQHAWPTFMENNQKDTPK